MHWPDGNAEKQVAAAKELGFADLYYYGVDEPTKPDQIVRCQKEAERRQRAGLHMFTAINSKSAQPATRDFIDRPDPPGELEKIARATLEELEKQNG